MPCQHCENLADIKVEVAAMKVVVDLINKGVNGNGQPGLMQRVGALEIWRSWMLGSLAAIGTIMGLVGGVLARTH